MDNIKLGDLYLSKSIYLVQLVAKQRHSNKLYEIFKKQSKNKKKNR